MSYRDLTSSFDIVGPYYTSEEQKAIALVHSKALDNLILYFRNMYVHDFRTVILVCDVI